MMNLGRRVLAVIMALMLLVPALSIVATAEPAQRIELNIDSITIGVGQSVKTVKATVLPADASKTLKWKSADESIATVTSAGKIKGVKKGATTITISAENGAKAELKVTVVKKGKGVKKITLSKKSATVTRGKSVTLKATLNPKKPKNKTVIWKSSDESIAMVSANGKVTGVGKGAATISAISSSGKTATCKVTVEGVKVKKVKLSGKKSMLRNETQQLTAKLTPNDADNQELKWKTSDKKIATVDANGVVTALKKGTVTITATAKDGGKAKGTFKITVKKGAINTNPTPVPTATPTPIPTATPAPNPAHYTTLELEDGTLEITGYLGNDKEIQIPATINGKVVTSIGEKAFYECGMLTSVIIPNSVTSIGCSAFEFCGGLTSVKLPDGVTTIEDYTFKDCGRLKSVKIPNGVTGIGKSAFSGCDSLASVTLPDSLISVGNWIFNGCSSLKSVTIPNGVTSIGAYAFNGCSSLKSVTIPNGVTGIGGSAFKDCVSLANVTLPDKATIIGREAFRNCISLTSITIPDGVTNIGGFAFENCSRLSSVKLPNGLRTIEGWVFADCANLTSITIPGGVTRIWEGTFSGCSNLASVIIPNGMKKIEDWVFYGCSSLKKVKLPEGLTDIGEYAFSDCVNLASATIPEGVKSIKYKTFSGCKALKSVTIPSSVNSISDAFPGCPDSLTIYGDAGSYAETYAKENGIKFAVK